MIQNLSLLKYYQPHLYKSFTRQKTFLDTGKTFLFYGKEFTGKEWSVMQILQLLNCSDFTEENHRPLECKTCQKIYSLREDVGIYSIFTHMRLDIFKYLLEEQKKAPSSASGGSFDTLNTLNLLHYINKAQRLLTQQEVKQSNDPSGAGGSSKLTKKKLTDISNLLTEIKYTVKNNRVLELKEKPLKDLITTLESISYKISVSYIHSVLKKLYVKSSYLSKRVLIIKDPIYLSPTILNLLLKTVEEPPENLFIFFICNQPKKLLSTIRSRCLPFHFKPYPLDVLDTLKQHHKVFEDFNPSFLKAIQKPSFPSSESNSLEIGNYIDYYQKSLLDGGLVNAQKKQILEKLALGVREYGLSPEKVKEVLSFLAPPKP